ncbi:MAG: hypothetical protein ABIE75_02895 [Candidatus Omnitrophota bacterium]
MNNQSYTKDLEGKQIKEIFCSAENISKLHKTLISKRGEYFRRKLLHSLEKELSFDDICRLRTAAELQEAQRHLNKLLEFQLIERIKKGELDIYKRTPKGEKAINALRALEVDIGRGEAHKIYLASLGTNSIKLFLRVYGDKREADLKTRKIKYTPFEIGNMSSFLPRNIEGIAAIDKLSDAELLIYEEDGNIYLNPKKARGFYKYLKSLYKIITH